MLCVFAPSVTVMSLSQPRKVPSGMTVMPDRSPTLSRRRASLKTFVPREVTLEVRLTETRYWQPRKAESRTSVTLSGSSTERMFMSPRNAPSPTKRTGAPS